MYASVARKKHLSRTEVQVTVLSHTAVTVMRMTLKITSTKNPTYHRTSHLPLPQIPVAHLLVPHLLVLHFLATHLLFPLLRRRAYITFAQPTMVVCLFRVDINDTNLLGVFVFRRLLRPVEHPLQEYYVDHFVHHVNYGKFMYHSAHQSRPHCRHYDVHMQPSCQADIRRHGATRSWSVYLISIFSYLC